jgi:glycerol-3-phosphate dehydrogenase (NAD(P)+)
MSSSPDVASRRDVSVIGLGAWGGALALHCARLGHTVTAWHRPGERFKALLEKGEIRAAKDALFKLPKTVKLTSDIGEALSGDQTPNSDRDLARLIIIALPARAWGEVLPQILKVLEQRPSKYLLISATKGLLSLAPHSDDAQTPLSWVADTLKVDRDRLAVVSGPSFASDLVAQTPITLVAASKSGESAREIAISLSGPALRVYTSGDPLGVELGGILKNVIVLAVGISDALGYGPSTRAALITRGLAEMTRLGVALGVEQQTMFGLSGLGDLVMTATDDQSRNRGVGLALGRGVALDHILRDLGATAEGVYSAPIALGLAKRVGVDVPIMTLVARVLRGEIAPRDLAANLMSRPLRGEG